jgi:hypothetical protein
LMPPLLGRDECPLVDDQVSSGETLPVFRNEILWSQEPGYRFPLYGRRASIRC